MSSLMNLCVFSSFAKEKILVGFPQVAWREIQSLIAAAVFSLLEIMFFPFLNMTLFICMDGSIAHVFFPTRH